MTVSELMHKISSTELSEWMAFDRIEPIGERRADFQAAVISHTIASTLGKRKDGRPFRYVDFMPLIERPKTNIAKTFRAKMAHLVKRKDE